MEIYTLTEQDIVKANNYVPLVRKIALAKTIAPFCVDYVQMGIKNDNNTVTSIPDRARENCLRKIQFSIGLLLQEYLKKDYQKVVTDTGEPVEYCATADEVDKYAHILNQIERIKQSKVDIEIRNKCFDLLFDYKELCKILSTEIYSSLQEQNDVVGRLNSLLSAQLTPEMVNDVIKRLKEVGAKRRGEITNGNK